MRVTVIGGAGYVGLITGIGLAELGHHVLAVDISSEKVAMLQSGKSPIYEDGVDLEDVLRRNLGSGKILFTADFSKAVRHAEVIFIAVGTPQDTGGQADLSQVIDVAWSLLGEVEDYTGRTVFTHRSRAACLDWERRHFDGHPETGEQEQHAQQAQQETHLTNP